MAGLVPAYLAAAALMLRRHRDESDLAAAEPAIGGPGTGGLLAATAPGAEPDPGVGPVLVTVQYTGPAGADQARSWRRWTWCAARGSAPARCGGGCSAPAETADRFVEVYLVPSWDEHLRQHGGRLTGEDRRPRNGPGS